MKEVNELRNLKEYHQSVLSLLETEYQTRKNLKENLTDFENKKKEFEKNNENKKNFLCQIPKEIKKISDIMKEFMTVFKINQSFHPEQHLVFFYYFFFFLFIAVLLITQLMVHAKKNEKIC